MRTSFTSTAILLRLLLFSFGKECLVRCQNNENRRIYLDRFTYENIDQYNKVNVGDGTHTAIDYSPDNWGDITCNEGSRLDECEGYRDKWDTGREWEITKNYCKWCPAGEGIDCGRHHQSPIDLKRGVGLDWDVTSPYYSEMANECIVSLYLPKSIFVGMSSSFNLLTCISASYSHRVDSNIHHKQRFESSIGSPLDEI